MSELQTLQLDQNEDDDTAFLDIVQCSVLGTARLVRPKILHLIHIDHKWRRFSGKLLGAVGVRKPELTVPPFNPHRVLSERVFEMADDARGIALANVPPLHASRGSEENTRVRLRTIYDSAVIAWYSGRSGVNSRAALMIYTLSGYEPATWYAGFEKREKWEVVHRSGVSEQEFSEILAQGSDVK